MRIDGLGTESVLPAGSRAQTVSAGDIVQGRVVASDNGRLQLRLTDGSTLQARVAEGVSLEDGTVVRLQIGERQDGIPTARILERTPVGSGPPTGSPTSEQLVGDALRALGEKAVPILVDRAMQLVQEAGIPEGQAAFLAANAFEGADPAGNLLGRMLEGRYAFGANLQALSNGLAEVVASLPQAERDAALTQQQQTLSLGKLADSVLEEAAGKLISTGSAPGNGSDSVLVRNGVALSTALREALGQVGASGATPQQVLTALQQSLSELPGGRLLLSILVPGLDAAATSSAPAGAEAAAGETTGAGSGAPLAAAGTPVAGTAPSVPLGGNAAETILSGRLSDPLGTQTPLNGQAGIPAAGAQSAGSATNATPLPAQAEGSGQGGTQGGAQGNTLPGNAVLLPVMDMKAEQALTGLLARVASAMQEAVVSGASAPEARSAVATAFDLVFARTGADAAAGTQREVDIGRMAQSVREQLEWSSQVLSRTDTDTAAMLRPLLEDATTAMRLFNQVSTYQTFVQVPLQINGQDARGELYVMKRKGGRGRIDASDFTLFLSLDTENLGHLETLAHARNRQVTLQFRVDDEEVQALLRDLKPTLYEGLEHKGYRLVDLKVRTSMEEPISVLTALRAAEERLGQAGGVDVRI